MKKLFNIVALLSLVAVVSCNEKESPVTNDIPGTVTFISPLLSGANLLSAFTAVIRTALLLFGFISAILLTTVSPDSSSKSVRSVISDSNLAPAKVKKLAPGAAEAVTGRTPIIMTTAIRRAWNLFFRVCFM